jgi:hypothetical protein
LLSPRDNPRRISTATAVLLASVLLAPFRAVADDRPQAVACDPGALRFGTSESQRQRVWQAIAAITASAADEQPLFESWYGEDAVFGIGEPESATRGIRGFSRVSSDQAPDSIDGGAAQRGDVPVLTYALYNEAAYAHIRSHRLDLKTELDALRSSGPTDDTVAGNRSIPPFPAGAVVLKTVWWPIAGNSVTPLPVWDADDDAKRRGGADYLGWRRVVGVDASGSTRYAPHADVDFAGRTFRDAPRVGLAAFHSVAVGARTAESVMRDRDARKTALVVLGREIRAGDHLVLVGANLAIRAVDDWVWATFWWHDRPEEGPFAEGRPRELNREWRNYLMDAAFDSSLPAAPDGGPHVCFNPWLEGRFPDGGHGPGTVSNCVTCHRRASYPPVDFLPVTRGEPDLAGDPAYAPGRLRTGSLWSIALHARP